MNTIHIPAPILRGTGRVGRWFICAAPGCAARVFSERPAGVSIEAHVYPAPESVRCAAHAHPKQEA